MSALRSNETMASLRPPHTLIIGTGNVSGADGGFGVRAAEALYGRYFFADRVCVLAGEQTGAGFSAKMDAAEYLLIFAAIDVGLPPATLRLIRDDDVVRMFVTSKVSVEKPEFQQLFSSPKFCVALPNTLALIGVQPERLGDHGKSLSESVRLMINPAIRTAYKVLQSWQVQIHERAKPLAGTEIISAIRSDALDSPHDPASTAKKR